MKLYFAESVWHLFVTTSVFGVRYCSSRLVDNDLVLFETTDVTGQETIVVKCADLIRIWPYYCNPEAVIGKEKRHPAEECRKSCRGVSYKCVDTPMTFGGHTCASLVKNLVDFSRSNHFCSDSYKYKDVCCKSCSEGQRAAPQKQQCTDKQSILIRVYGQWYKKCPELLELYPFYCTQQRFSELGGYCCETCRKIPVTKSSCLLNPDKRFSFAWNPDRKYSCKSWLSVGFNKCECLKDEVMTNCCPLCHGNDPKQMAALQDMCKCRNHLHSKDTVTYNGAGGSVTYTSCRILVARNPEVCANKQIEGEGGKCCEACQGVDPYCLLDKSYRVKVNDKVGIKDCYKVPKYYRHEFCCSKDQTHPEYNKYREFQMKCCKVCKIWKKQNIAKC